MLLCDIVQYIMQTPSTTTYQQAVEATYVGRPHVHEIDNLYWFKRKCIL